MKQFLSARYFHRKALQVSLLVNLVVTFPGSIVMAQAQPCYGVNGVTVAGTGTSGTAVSQLNDPEGVAIDAAGFIYVSENNNHRITKFAPNSTAGNSGTIVAGTGSAGSGPNELKDPRGIAVDANGFIYVADSGNNRIQKFAPNSTKGDNGTVVAGTGNPGTGPHELDKPFGVAVDANGFIYVADYINDRIQKFAPTSTGGDNGTTVAGTGSGGSTADKLQSPGGVTVGADGFIYVADSGNNRIQKFAPTSTGGDNGTTVAGGNYGSTADKLASPCDVEVDAAGYIYVSDGDNDRIQVFAPGSVGGSSGTTVAGTGDDGSAANELDTPRGIAVDAAGAVYVADSDNERIQKFSIITVVPAGISSLVADESGCPVKLTGQVSGTAFVFTGPNGYVFSNIYRQAGSYQAIGINVVSPGVYKLESTSVNMCGGSTPAIRTVTVSRACP